MVMGCQTSKDMCQKQYLMKLLERYRLLETTQCCLETENAASGTRIERLLVLEHPLVSFTCWIVKCNISQLRRLQ